MEKDVCLVILIPVVLITVPRLRGRDEVGVAHVGVQTAGAASHGEQPIRLEHGVVQVVLDRGQLLLVRQELARPDPGLVLLDLVLERLELPVGLGDAFEHLEDPDLGDVSVVELRRVQILDVPPDILFQLDPDADRVGLFGALALLLVLADALERLETFPPDGRVLDDAGVADADHGLHRVLSRLCDCIIQLRAEVPFRSPEEDLADSHSQHHQDPESHGACPQLASCSCVHSRSVPSRSDVKEQAPRSDQRSLNLCVL